MPGKQARVLCPVCQEPIPPDETECGNCGAFVIDEAVVRLSRAFGLDREGALKLFEAGFRHPTQLRGRDPNRVLEKGEVGLLFICTNCGGFVAGADPKCPRCAAEFETEPEATAEEEEDILDLVLCPVCGADNDPEVVECEICGETLRETREPVPAAATVPVAAPEMDLEKVDEFLDEPEHPKTLHAVSPRREEDQPTAPPPVANTPAPGEPREVSARALRPIHRVRAPPLIPKPLADAVRSKPPASPTVRPAETRPSRAPTPTLHTTSPAPARARIILRSKREPVKVPEPVKPLAKAAPRKTILDARPNNLPRKRVRASGPRSAFTPETVAGLGLATAAGLLLAGAMAQGLVSGGIAIFLAGLGAYLSIELLRGAIPRPSRSDGILLAAGIGLGLSAPALRGETNLGATALALAAAFTFAWTSRRLLRTPRRVLLAIASAVPLIGHGLAAYVDPTYATTLPWIIGILGSMPWPAALAAMEILRRKSATVFRRQIVRAERDVERKEYERSLTEYDRAIAAASKGVPGAEIPWYGKGATLILLGRYEEALRAIDRALDINPRNEVAWVNKGNALTRMGQLLDALRCFNAAIKVNPLYEVAWNNKGNALARLRKYDEALRCYEHALGIDPGYRGAWVNMGYVLTKLGRFDEAASCADRALRLDGGRRPEPA
ncbi:MAG: tetratricopeptide repeat protein [Thermoplasmata archaeon]